MVKLKFIYMKNIYEIPFLNNNINMDLIEKYCNKINQNVDDLYYLYRGKFLSLNNFKLFNKSKKDIIISIFSIKKNKNNNLKTILCPECNNLVNFNISENKIILDNCKNNHKNIIYDFNEFIESQISNYSKIICDICKNNISYYKKFYFCKCGKYICPLCCEKHHPNILKEEINELYNKCDIHQMKFTSYCNDCHINLCPKCEEGHQNNKNHKLIYLKKINLDENKIKDISENILAIIEKYNNYKNSKKELKIIFMDALKYVDIYIDNWIKLFIYFLNSLKKPNNFESINNIINLKLKQINIELEKILNENHIIKKFIKI